MSFNPQQIAEEIADKVLPAGISSVTTCMTRLRLTIIARDKVDLSTIKSILGVLGVVEAAEQLQIIIGPGKVNQVYDLLMPILEVRGQNGIIGQEENKAVQNAELTNSGVNNLKEQLKQKNSTPFKLFLKKLANIFIPLIPAFIGCGLVMGLVNVIAKSSSPDLFNGISFDKTTIGAIFKMIGSGITFGLALFVGLNASKEFGGTPIIGGVLAAVLNMPDLNNITVFGEHAVPGRGGVIAVLLVAILAAYLERYLRKIIPSSLDLFVTPTMVLLISGFAAIFILQPVGGLLSDLITNGCKLAVEHGGALAGFILSAAFLPLVMTGLHQGLIPIHAELIQTTGATILLPILAMAGAGQVGAALAVWLKTSNQRLKHVIKSSIIVGFLGVGEPLIYGVTLPLFKPFIAACIGGGIGGAFVAYFKLGATGIGISGLPLALLIHNGIFLYLTGILLAYLGGFIATLLIGFDDGIIE